MDSKPDPDSPPIIPLFFKRYLDRNGVANILARWTVTFFFLCFSFLFTWYLVNFYLGRISPKLTAVSWLIAAALFAAILFRGYLLIATRCFSPKMWSGFGDNPILLWVTITVIMVLAIEVFDLKDHTPTTGSTAAGREWGESALSAESAMSKLKAGNLGDITPTEARNFERQKGLSIGESIQVTRTVREIYGK